MDAYEYIAEIERLIGAERYEDALGFSTRFGGQVTGQLSGEQYYYVGSLLGTAKMIVTARQWRCKQQPDHDP